MEKGCYFKLVDKYLDEGNEKYVTAGPVRIQTIIACSKQYDDGLCVQLEEELSENSQLTIQTHRNCVSTYTSKTHIKRALKRKGDLDPIPSTSSSPKRRRRSDTPGFNFQEHCLFCGEICNLQKDPKNPGRWRKTYLCRSLNVVHGGTEIDLKSDILFACKRRNDEWTSLVRIRVEGAVSDLHAADARYHVDCKVSFMSERSIRAAASHPKTQEDIDEAFNQLVSCMIEDKTKIWNSVELHEQYQVYDGDILSKTQLLNKLFDHFDDDLLILSAAGVASIIVFRSKAPSLFKLVNDSDDKGYLDGSIKRFVKQILGEIRDIKTDKSQYTTDITTETLENRKPVTET